jgi:hypothetical protein
MPFFAAFPNMLEEEKAPAARVASTACAISCDRERSGGAGGGGGGSVEVGEGFEVSEVADGLGDGNDAAVKGVVEETGASGCSAVGFTGWVARGKTRTCSRRSTACWIGALGSERMRAIR